MSEKKHNIAILGSTGSIGTQALDIVAENPRRFSVSTLVARSSVELLAGQARRFNPARVVIGRPELENQLRSLLAGTDVQVLSGDEAIEQVAAYDDTDLVLTAMVGYSGLAPTLAAIDAGKTIALANKETLVAGGELIKSRLQKSPARILPVDSEHSAIFQCLQGEEMNPLQKIILTASGGPFRLTPPAELASVTAADALKHPNWDMGAKVTIDSASMMNKGFEMIEARWLFDVAPSDIEVVVHPQSIVHSMVEFADGSVKAQLGLPDMHLPIAYALSYPERLPSPRPRLKVSDYASLTFEKPDLQKFPLLALAFEAIAEGGVMPCVLNAANEIAVQAFLQGRIKFTDMGSIARRTMELFTPEAADTLDILEETNSRARKLAQNLITEYNH